MASQLQPVSPLLSAMFRTIAMKFRHNGFATRWRALITTCLSEHWKTSAYKLTRADAASLIERNLAMELLQKLLKGELRVRDHQNVVQARSFAEMRERMLRRCQNGAVEAALVIAELVALARDVREVNISACPNTNWRSTRQWRPATAR